MRHHLSDGRHLWVSAVRGFCPGRVGASGTPYGRGRPTGVAALSEPSVGYTLPTHGETH